MEKITGTLKSHTDFKTIRLLQKSTKQHEILHAKTADQDVFRSFFQKFEKITRSSGIRGGQIKLTFRHRHPDGESVIIC